MHGFVISVYSYYCIIHVYVQQQHRATTAHIRSAATEVRTRQIHYERFGKNNCGIRFEISVCPKGKISGPTAATYFHGIRFYGVLPKLVCT